MQEGIKLRKLPIKKIFKSFAPRDGGHDKELQPKIAYANQTHHNIIWSRFFLFLFFVLLFPNNHIVNRKIILLMQKGILY